VTVGARCWHGDRRLGGRDVLDGLSGARSPAWFARGQAGVSDAHEGLKAAVAKVLHASWQRCRVHFMRNVLAHAGKHGRRVVAAFIATAFAQEDAEMARLQWRQVADQLRPKVAKLAALMDKAEADVLAFMKLSQGSQAEDPLHQSAGAAQRRDQAAHRRRWHLPQ